MYVVYTGKFILFKSFKICAWIDDDERGSPQKNNDVSAHMYSECICVSTDMWYIIKWCQW